MTTAAPATRRVLVVDDDADTAQTMVELLALEGHVATSRPSLAALQASPPPWTPDVVCSDYHLAGDDADGVQVLLYARLQWAQARLALVSGMEPGTLTTRLPASLGAVAQFMKPLDVDGLLDFLHG